MYFEVRGVHVVGHLGTEHVFLLISHAYLNKKSLYRQYRAMPGMGGGGGEGGLMNYGGLFHFINFVLVLHVGVANGKGKT